MGYPSGDLREATRDVVAKDLATLFSRPTLERGKGEEFVLTRRRHSRV